MVKIIKKVGMTLASVLILASMFTGVALAKPAMQEFQNEKLYAQIALAMQLSEDPVGTFYTFTPAEQEQVRAAMSVHFANMQAIVERDGSDEEMQAYIATLPEAISYIIQIDFTYTRLEFSEGALDLHTTECIALTHQHDDDNDEDGVYAKIARTCPNGCYMYRYGVLDCYGTINGQLHWRITVTVEATHDGTVFNHAYAQGNKYITTSNGWSTKGSIEGGGKKVKDTVSSVIFGYNHSCGASFSNGWFTTESGYVSVTAAIDFETGDCKYIPASYDGPNVAWDWAAVLNIVITVIGIIITIVGIIIVFI